MHRRTESLRVREPCVSRGIHSRAREAFEALLSRRQPGHRRRSDAEELRAAEATGRGMAGDAVVNGFGKAADLPGIHRGGIWGFRSTWRDECTICTFSLCMRSSRREPCGASRTHSPARSRNWSQYRSTRRQRSWRGFCNQSVLRSAPPKCRRTVLDARLIPQYWELRSTRGSCASVRRAEIGDQHKSNWRIPMKLRRNEYCPIHRSMFCCGRQQTQKQRRLRLGVQRIEDPHHPRGYRELRSPAEMRKLLNRKSSSKTENAQSVTRNLPTAATSYRTTGTRKEWVELGETIILKISKQSIGGATLKRDQVGLMTHDLSARRPTAQGSHAA